MSQLSHKVVIITGAGTGIGRGIAEGFVKEGARVAFVGRRLAMLQEAAAGLPPEQVLLCPCDVADRSAVEAMVQQVIDTFGPVDILVNNAGTNTSPRTVGEVAPDDWDLTIAINLTGVFNCTRAVLPGMRQQQSGLVINVSSIAGLRASKMAGAAYSASKHGVVALTNNINEEEWENGVRACALCPGEVNTPILDRRPQPPAPERRAAMLQPEDLAAAALMVAKLPPRACVPMLVMKPAYQTFN